METLISNLKEQLCEALSLEDIKPEEIGTDDPLFGDEGIGLDSIDALEIILLIEKKYGIKITDPKKVKEAFTSVRTIAQFISDNK
ncbi:MAG: acyl carrier protein [Paludibacteraceae bacterium]|nr:acyl carrier protein [Paludibacteraceae bacterium]